MLKTRPTTRSKSFPGRRYYSDLIGSRRSRDTLSQSKYRTETLERKWKWKHSVPHNCLHFVSVCVRVRTNKLSKISTTDLFEEIVSLFNIFLITEISSRQGLYNIGIGVEFVSICHAHNWPKQCLILCSFGFNIVFPQFFAVFHQFKRCVPLVLMVCLLSFEIVLWICTSFFIFKLKMPKGWALPLLIGMYIKTLRVFNVYISL